MHCNTIKTMLPNLTCPELKPQAHFENRHPRDYSHSHFELRNVAVARARGTSKMVTSIKFMQNARSETRQAFLLVFYKHVRFATFQI